MVIVGTVATAGFIGLVAILFVGGILIATSGSRSYQSNYSPGWSTSPSNHEFRGEAMGGSFTGGSFDPVDIRNSSIHVDGEVLTFPN